MGDAERLTRVENDVTNLRIDMAALKQDTISGQQLSDKLDKNLDKLQEVVVTMTTMIKVHEADLKNHIQSDRDIQQGLESKLDAQNTAITTLTVRLNEIEKKILLEIAGIKGSEKKDKKKGFFGNLKTWHWVLIGIAVGGLVANKFGHDFFLNLLSNVLPAIF